MSTTLVEAPANVTTHKESQDPGHVKHYIAPKPDRNAGALITEAMVMGTPVVALCGAVFVPSRDPSKYPLCGGCKDAFDNLFRE